MEKKCLACEHLKNPRFEILRTAHWNVVLDTNHAYFGRTYVTLLTHKARLSDLTEEEWHEYEQIVQRLERAYKDIYGADPLNWGCYMNNAFREKPFNPHVSWHVFPRYEKAPEMDGIVFNDQLFGEFFDDNAKRVISDTMVERIAAKLVDYLSVH